MRWPRKHNPVEPTRVMLVELETAWDNDPSLATAAVVLPRLLTALNLTYDCHPVTRPLIAESLRISHEWLQKL